MTRLALLLLAAPLLVAGQQPSSSPPLDPALSVTTLPLYDTPPSGPASDLPTLTVFPPQPGHGIPTAVLIAPGGAYLGLASNLEGRQVADWFAARGITAFVLRYRLGERNLYPTPLEDARRAMRLIRASAATYGFAPDRVGVVGFSAGGHLAATLATLASAPGPASDRPDFLILGYPWLNAMEPQRGKEINYCSLLHTTTPAQCASFAQAYTPKLHVSASTPTTFIFSTTDDTVVPVRASTEFYDAMVHAGAPIEMHLFRHGGHGSGLGSGDPALDLWPTLLEAWLRAGGLLTPAAAR